MQAGLIRFLPHNGTIKTRITVVRSISEKSLRVVCYNLVIPLEMDGRLILNYFLNGGLHGFIIRKE